MVRKESRGVLKLIAMNCGSGKTLVEVSVILRAPEPLHTLVVPTLELLWQFVKNIFLENGSFGPESAAFAELAASCELRH